MDKLKKRFLKIQKEFLAQKSFFEKKLASWQKKKNKTTYKQAKFLFDDLQKHEQEISIIFNGSDWRESRPVLKVKINAFEETFKELMLFTRTSLRKWIEATIIVVVIVFVLRNFFFGIYHVPTSSAEPTLLVGDRVWGNKFVYLFKNPQHGEVVMFEDPVFAYDSQNSIQNFWQEYVGVKVPLLGLKGGPRSMAKRIIALPGDVVEGRIEDGKPVVYRNGKKINEPYVNTYPLLVLKKEIGLIESEDGDMIPDFLKKKKKVVLYSYDPKKDFEEQPFYYIDYQSVLYDRKTGYMKMYKSGVPSYNKDGKAIDVFGPFIVPKDMYWVMGDNRRNSIDSREWQFVDKSKIAGKASFIIWSLDSEEPLWLFDLIKNPFRFFSQFRWDRFFKEIE